MLSNHIRICKHNIFLSDGAYLTASRQILETITEETSDDEENNGNWSQYEHEHSIWSSESETGSVIRMEVHNGGFVLLFFCWLTLGARKIEEVFVFLKKCG